MSVTSNLTINSDRLWTSLMEMAEIGPGIAGGNNRQTLTDEDAQGRALFAGWCEDAGLTLSVDEMGNMFARRDGTDPTLASVMVGSHLDTQPTGGKYDGVLGVLAGLEVMRTLSDLEIDTKRPVVVANWTNEEGARFAPPMLSSGVFAGQYDLEFAYSRKDADGLEFGAELQRIGWKGPEKVGGMDLYSYLELHIEQGPILEAAGNDIGVVVGVQGLKWLQFTLTGREAHTGSTPMDMRINASLAMGRIIDMVDGLIQSHQPNAMAAVGHLECKPNSRNVMPGQIDMTVDLRSPDAALLDQLHAEIEQKSRAICDLLGVGCTVELSGHYAPVEFDASLCDIVRTQAKSLGLPYQDITSGAGHDACWLSKVTPSVMIMCPCVDGISHNEAEEISPQWAKAGADVLLASVVEIANRAP
ncbi:MAG: Zn-dependent hydrolase [Thalassovita sp.]